MDRRAVKMQRKVVSFGRAHIGGEIAALALVLIGGAAFAAWRASRSAEDDLDARTRARLRPRRTQRPNGPGAD